MKIGKGHEGYGKKEPLDVPLGGRVGKHNTHFP
jgi:hypothetical protein